MKKLLSVILSIIIVALCFSACTKNSANDTDNSTAQEKIKIVATTFPEYDWTKEILGDTAQNVDLTLLIDSGVDLHSYQPSAEDILKISTCDLLIYVGGTSDSWVDDALKEAANKNMKVLNLIDLLGDSVKEEEIIEGMEHEHSTEDEEHEHASEEDIHTTEDTHEHETEYDEHVWLSLKNAQIFCSKIADSLSEIDPDNSEVYKANVKTYNDKLSALDSQYAQTVNSSKNKTLIFGDRFPFRYMTEDYSLEYYAAFAGCSAETEASFETITFLADKADELGVNCILTIDGSDHKIAKTIIENTKNKDLEILTLNSLQSVTDKEISNGVTYYSVMEENLSVLQNALK